jgi:hypothetical protein
MLGASDSELSAMAHRAVQHHSAFPVQCSASLLAIQVVQGRSRSRRHIDSRAPEVGLVCFAPAGVDRTGEDSRHKRQR